MTHSISKENSNVEFLFPISRIICILAQPSPLLSFMGLVHRTLGGVTSLRFSVILESIYLSIYTITGCNNNPLLWNCQ